MTNNSRTMGLTRVQRVTAAVLMAWAAPALGLGIGLGFGLGGCSGSQKQAAYARAYPVGVAQVETLDVQVFRRDQRLELTNTSGRAFGPSRLWLNMRFSRPIEGIAVGETLDLKLREFVDEFGQPFRAGGFFAAESPDTVVLTQVETTDAAGKPVFIGLVTVQGRPEEN